MCVAFRLGWGGGGGDDDDDDDDERREGRGGEGDREGREERGGAERVREVFRGMRDEEGG